MGGGGLIILMGPERRGNNAVSNGQSHNSDTRVQYQWPTGCTVIGIIGPDFDSFAAIMSKFLKVLGCQREKYWQILIRGIRVPSESLIICTKHSRFAWRDLERMAGCLSHPPSEPHLCLVYDGWRLWLIRLCHKIAFLHWESERPRPTQCQARVW